jgi:CRISPR-associated protein Cmr6
MKHWRVPRFIPWDTPYPLPRDTSAELMAVEGQCANLGLLMDRYLAYSQDRQRLPEFVREFQDRQALAIDLSPLAELVTATHARWEKLAASLTAVAFQARPEWRVVIGTSTHSLLEVGITLHRVYGLPFVPASALKGVARLYAEAVLELEPAQVERLFGSGGEEDARQGDLIFLDGCPVTPPQIERDVLNPHYSAYYGGRENVPPADYLSPRPVFFLTVGRESLFSFGVASGSGDRRSAAAAAGWLEQALAELGVGAKTAAGYGYWEIVHPSGLEPTR